MAKSQFQPVAPAAAAVQEFHPHAVKTWLAVFPITALGVLFIQPSFIMSSLMATMLMVSLVAIASLSMIGDDMRRFQIGQMMMGLIAPVQLSLMIWVSVYAGHMMAGDALVASTLAAFAMFAGLMVVDALVSIALLLVAGHASPVCGLSIASLITGKYASLFGRVV